MTEWMNYMRLSVATERMISSSSEELIYVARYITELGGVAGTLIVLTLAYWFGPRQRVATLLGIITAGLLFILALKEAIALPRPPTEWAAIETTDPYGFPSGHAFSAVVVYGGLTVILDWERSIPHLTGIITLIIGICLSRVILGVHYLGDVIVGAFVGGVFLFLMNWLTSGRPARAFGIALLFAGPVYLLIETAIYVWIALGISLAGGLAAVLWIGQLPVCRDWIDGLILVAGGVAVVCVYLVGAAVIEAGPALAVLISICFAGILATPGLLSIRSGTMRQSQV